MPLHPALLCEPLNERNLTWAAQVGTEEIVAKFPGVEFEDLRRVHALVASFGLKLSVIERLLPHDAIVHNKPGRSAQIAAVQQLVRNMGRLGVRCLCYNWMPMDDWSRTALDVRERGGSLVTAFDARAAEENKVAHLEGDVVTEKITSREELWHNLKFFLEQVIPVCEASGVVLALHPDDPPLAEFRGRPQIIYNYEACIRVVNLVKSPANGLCFCQGTFASAGLDVPAGIRLLAPFINFVHFRDVVGEVPSFRESWQDNGKTDMAECMRAYIAAGLDVPIRPDHVPTMHTETNETPGYHMLGRLFAIGYIRGLLHALGPRSAAGSLLPAEASSGVEASGEAGTKRGHDD